MATTYYTDIQKLYVAYFNRPADPAGLAYWETVVEGAKGSTAAVSAAFAASAEYKAAYAGMSNADIVNTVYTNLFGRAAEDAGKTYWAGLLDAKKITIDAVVTQIAAGAQGTDLTAYNDKVLASAQFTAAVDTDAEKAGYSGDAANKVAKAFLSGITDANSLAASTTPAALNGAVAATVAAGTPFSVASALSQINAANKALTTFVQSIDVDGDSTTTTTVADLNNAQASAVTKVGGDLTDSASSSLFKASTTTQAVRDALVSAQQAINAGKLAADQQTVADDNTKVAKIDGLTTAVSASTAAAAALTAAKTAMTAADADLAAKKAAFPVANSGTGATPLNITSSAITLTTSTGTTTLADIDVNGKATLHTGVDATKYTGLTDLITSYNADVVAHATVTTATNTANFAQLGVNMLDVSASTSTLTYTDSSNVVQNTGLTEAQVVAAIAAQINATTANTVATGATPTVAQVQTELAVLHAQTDQTAYNAFLNLVNAEIGGKTVAVNTASATVTTDTTNANNAASTYTTASTAFEGGSNVTVSNNALVFTATSATSATTLATIDSTGHAVVATGITETTNPGVTALITAYNAKVDTAATLATDKAALTTLTNALNPLTSKLATDTAVVTADTKAISTLAKDVAALQAANANATTLAGYQASVDTYTKALTDKGFNPIDLNTAGGTEFGTAKSDIFMVHTKSETIAAFGLQGSDSVSVGSGYTLVQGSVTGANAVKGDNAALEIFVSNDGAGNAVLQIEQHAYSGSVAATTGEIVTITLTGVDATTLHLNNGIITSGTTTV
jgi:hypothetical protein